MILFCLLPTFSDQHSEIRTHAAAREKVNKNIKPESILEGDRLQLIGVRYMLTWSCLSRARFLCLKYVYTSALLSFLRKQRDIPYLFHSMHIRYKCHFDTNSWAVKYTCFMLCTYFMI